MLSLSARGVRIGAHWRQGSHDHGLQPGKPPQPHHHQQGWCASAVVSRIPAGCAVRDLGENCTLILWYLFQKFIQNSATRFNSCKFTRNSGTTRLRAAALARVREARPEWLSACLDCPSQIVSADALLQYWNHAPFRTSCIQANEEPAPVRVPRLCGSSGYRNRRRR